MVCGAPLDVESNLRGLAENAKKRPVRCGMPYFGEGGAARAGVEPRRESWLA